MSLKTTLSDLSSKPGVRKSYLWGACLAAPFISAYFYFIFKYSINFPYLDDYPAILNFITSFVKPHNKLNILGKASLLLVQNNEHRIVFTKAVSLLQYYLCGQLNFKILILVGNIGLLFISWLLFKESVIKQRVSAFLIVPVVALLFNFSMYELCFWAEGSLQNIWVIVFALASFYFYYQPSRSSFLLSIFFASLATFSSGNGILVFFAAFFITILQQKRVSRKNMIWIIAAFISGGLYFYKYDFLNHTSILKNLSIGALRNMATYYFVFIGHCMDTRLGVAIITGIAALLLAGYACYKRFFITQPVLSACVVFILCTGGIATLGRAQYTPYQALASRYVLNSAVLISALFLMYGIEFKSKLRVWHLLACLSFITIANIYTLKNSLSSMINDKARFDYDYRLSSEQKLSGFNYEWFDADKAYPRQCLKLAGEAYVFDFEGSDPALLLQKVVEDTTQRVKFKVTNVERNNDVITVEGWSTLSGQKSDAVMNFMYLLNDADSVIRFLVPNKVHNSGHARLQDGDIDLDEQAGYQASINISKLPVGRYHISLATTDSRVKIITNINVYFDI